MEYLRYEQETGKLEIHSKSMNFKGIYPAINIKCKKIKYIIAPLLIKVTKLFTHFTNLEYLIVPNVEEFSRDALTEL